MLIQLLLLSEALRAAAQRGQACIASEITECFPAHCNYGRRRAAKSPPGRRLFHAYCSTSSTSTNCIVTSATGSETLYFDRPVLHASMIREPCAIDEKHCVAHISTTVHIASWHVAHAIIGTSLLKFETFSSFQHSSCKLDHRC